MFGIFQRHFPYGITTCCTLIVNHFYLILLVVYLSSSLFHPGVNTSSLPQLSGSMVDEQTFCTC